MLGNMLFLFVFGRSIEDRFGHFPFLLLYLISGVAAALVQIVVSPGSRVPTIGASGAIAGVLGAYFICYPGARITTLIPLFIFFWTVQVPAILLLGYWFLIQFIAGFQMLSIQTATAGGVAWWAHIGGFTCGVLLALIMRPQRRGPVVEIGVVKLVGSSRRQSSVDRPTHAVPAHTASASDGIPRRFLFSPLALGQINTGQDEAAADQHL